MTPALSLLVGLAVADEPAPAPGQAPAAAPAPRSPQAEGSFHGDVKLFFLAGVPHAWFGLADDTADLLDSMGLTEEEALEAYGLAADPFAQGVGSTRLKAMGRLGPVRLDVHWALAAQTAYRSTAVVGVGTGVGLRAPELLPLTWTPDTGSALALTHRVDRLVLSARLPHLDVALGRQPVSFGVGRTFAPLDLVNPFHPATIDAEYKPGVDALRLDAYAGTATRLTAVAAWAGASPWGDDGETPADPLTGDLIVAACGQVTVGVTDLLAFAGDIRSEPVFGLGTASSIGPVGVHAEATVTLPEDEDAFVRAVAGADWRPTETTTLMAEAYVQSFGATAPADYLDALQGPRVERGELWEAGQLYAALIVAQELSPLVHANLALVGNLRDPSALLSLGAGWSVADNADLALGATVGLGQPPDEVELELGLDPDTQAPTLVLPDDDALGDSVRSEFGLYPAMGYVQVRTYF